MFLLKVIAGVACVVLTSATVQAATVFTRDFEDGTLSGWSTGGSNGNLPTVDSSVKRAGRFSMRTFLDRANSTVSYRTEVSSGGREQELLGQGAERWYGFSIFLPSSYVADPIWEIVAQWHAMPDVALGENWGTRNPPLYVSTENGVWNLVRLWDSRPVNDRNYEGQKKYNLGVYETNKWTDFVVNVRWSPFSDGFLRVWKNGVKVLDLAGGVGFNDQSLPYFKMGIYKGWGNRVDPPGNVATRTLYHDEVRIAGGDASYSDVAPGGGSSVRAPSPPASVTVR